MPKCPRCRLIHNEVRALCEQCSYRFKQQYKAKMAFMSDEEKAKEVFRRQVRRSMERNIKFLFSYEEWVRWWEDNLGPDWLKKRGIKSGQYVMARKGDKGPYSKENVECITNNENHHRTAEYETSGGRKINNQQVIEIYLAKGKYGDIAKKYGIKPSTVASIKRKRDRLTATRHLE